MTGPWRGGRGNTRFLAALEIAVALRALDKTSKEGLFPDLPTGRQASDSSHPTPSHKKYFPKQQGTTLPIFEKSQK